VKTKAIYLLLFLGCLLVQPGYAGDIPDAIKSTLPPPELSAKTWILMDYHTGWVLASKDPDERIETASLSKIMTTYTIFQEIKSGNIKLDDMVHISKKAWKTGGSRMFIEVDTKVSVEDLLKGVIVQSGNDASVALAEYVAGSEDAFAARMNENARKLGMANSNFVNAPGLPDPDHYSTARDLSLVTAALIREFPEFYKWYSQREFTYNDITQHNRNLLLNRDPSADGVKTGYTKSAGYCLIGSAKREGMRLIATVTGTTSRTRRAKEVQSLLTYGFSNYKSIKLAEGGVPVTQIKVFKGDQKQLGIGVFESLYFTAPRDNKIQIMTRMNTPPSIIAPVSSGTEMANIEVLVGEERLMQYPLRALHPVGEGAWWERALDSVLLWFE
jgi:D-alanyl-D-alanine carboxypeptidase (penicillin-binding protein 5/6)